MLSFDGPSQFGQARLHLNLEPAAAAGLQLSSLFDHAQECRRRWLGLLPKLLSHFMAFNGLVDAFLAFIWQRRDDFYPKKKSRKWKINLKESQISTLYIWCPFREKLALKEFIDFSIVFSRALIMLCFVFREFIPPCTTLSKKKNCVWSC